MELLELHSVSKSYPSADRPSLTNVDLVLKQGSFAAVTGPSGSGKTTLLNIAAGLDDPSSGEAHIMGHKSSAMSGPERSKFRLNNLGFVFQAYNLLPVLTARENVELSSLLKKIAPAQAKQIALEALSKVGLAGLEDRRPALLSGGQQQRVAVARALANAPKIIFADEPTANLDSVNALQLIDLFKQLNRKHGISFLFSTHDQRLIEQVDICIKMRDGIIC